MWIAIGLMFLVAELGHPGLFLFISFFIGSLGAGLCALYGYSLLLQSAIFLITTVIAFFVLRSWIVNYETHVHRSNVYALQGKVAVVTAAIRPHEYGLVKVDGQIWRAQSHAEYTLVEQQHVRIVSVQGTRLIVETFTRTTH